MRKTRLAGRVGGFVIALAAGAAVGHFANWFDGLSPTELFLVVGGGLALVLFGAERFYRFEYSHEHIIPEHLDGLKATAQAIFDGIGKKQSTLMVNGKDCRDLFSHRPDLERACKKWDKAVTVWSQAGWTYGIKLSTAFAENGFTEDRFNRTEMLKSIQAVAYDREQRHQRQLAERQPMQWVWDVVPTNLPIGVRHDIYLRWGHGVLFIRDFDSTDDPVDVDDCKKRLQDLFDMADSSPELVEWVEAELVLERDEKFRELKDLLHDFGRFVHLRHGHGCAQCNS